MLVAPVAGSFIQVTNAASSIHEDRNDLLDVSRARQVRREDEAHLRVCRGSFRKLWKPWWVIRPRYGKSQQNV